MRTNPVTVYESKPATEWILGEPVQKMSPKYAHAAIQAALCSRLRAWARGRGRVGTEWRFWVTPIGEEARYLVPDIAYLSFERLPREAIDAAQEPQLSPDVAVEILSPSERATHIEHKTHVYLQSGSSAVVEIDPQQRTVRVHDRAGQRELRETDLLEHPSLPGFRLPLSDLFAELED